MNNFTATGNLTADPEYKSVGDSGLVSFDIANNRSWLKKGTGGDTGIDPDYEERTVYWNVTVWAKGLHERIMYDLKKGDPVLVSGRVDEDTWDDKDTGAKRRAKKLTVSGGDHDVVAVRKWTKRADREEGGNPLDSGSSSSDPFDDEF